MGGKQKKDTILTERTYQPIENKGLNFLKRSKRTGFSVQTNSNQSQKRGQKSTFCAAMNSNSRVVWCRLNGSGFPPRVALKAFNGSAKSARTCNPGSGTACGACIPL
jgi:hypothetical protein